MPATATQAEMPSKLLPGGYGRRLLVSLVDEIAASDPQRIVYSMARGKHPSEGFDDISMLSLSRAVDRCAWYIQETFGVGWGKGFPTLSYMGPMDLNYAVLTLASNKTGYKMLYNSPRNTLQAHLSLFEKTATNIFLTPPGYSPPNLKKILAARPMETMVVPSAEHWFEEGGEPVKPYPYTKTYDEARLDPMAVLHTSGSTGIPKPIVMTNGTFSTFDAMNALPLMGSRPVFPSKTLSGGKRIYINFPLFHSAGLGSLLGAGIYGECTVVRDTFPPSADIANAAHIYGNVQQSCLPPSMVADMAKNPEHLNNFARLEYVISGGGPIPKAVGDIVNTKTTFFTVMGSTECGIFPGHVPSDRADWEYFDFSPELGHEYRHVGGDLYEQVIVRRPELEAFQGAFATFPQLQEYPMKDLYSKHPTKEGFWTYRGRIDDIIVYSTGEKINPLDMEDIINANPLVSAALVSGLRRTQSALLVEAAPPPASHAEKEKIIDAIWPSVEAANKITASYGRVYRNMILFTTADKPMLRAGKGTVQRQLTEALYEPELDALFEANEKSLHANGAPNGATNGTANGDTNGATTVEDAVRHIVSDSADFDADPVQGSADLFELGLDSLQAIAISRRINEFLRSRGATSKAEPRTIYSCPTIAKLTAAVTALLVGQSADGNSSPSDEERTKKIYTALATDLPLPVRKPLPKPVGETVVLLTGSTGSMGSYILDILDKDPRVTRIYCLNRGPSSQGRQHISLAAKGIHLTHGEKVKFLDADITSTHFGLPTKDYMQLLSEVTDVIHNAWQVDFNLAVESFVNQLGAVRRFIDFSANSAFGARLLFMSSVGAMSGYSGPVSETVNKDDWIVPEAIGYGQSKYIAEKLLDKAAEEAGIPVTICRVGQIAGPTTKTGAWPKKEWLPSLLVSSKAIGKLPASLGRAETVNWVPVDVLGRVIDELVTQSPTRHSPGAEVYHITNPQTSNWSELAPTVAKTLGVEAVPLEAWVDALQESATLTEDLSQNPAVKLLDFYKALPNANQYFAYLETNNTVKASETLATLKPVGDEWMAHWMRQLEL